MTPSTENLITVNSLCKRFGSSVAIDHLDFTVPAGQIVMLLGANGSGKSTLLRIMARLIRPDSGKLETRGRVSYVGHKLQLYGALSVKENLTFFSALSSSQARAKISVANSIVDHFNLGSILNREVRSLSRGEQTRVALARAFSCRSRLLLLDEPTANLDQGGAASLLTQLKSCAQGCESPCSAIIATHDVSRLAPIASRAIVLDNARIVADAAQGSSEFGPALQRYQACNH